MSGLQVTVDGKVFDVRPGDPDTPYDLEQVLASALAKHRALRVADRISQVEYRTDPAIEAVVVNAVRVNQLRSELITRSMALDIDHLVRGRRTTPGAVRAWLNRNRTAHRLFSVNESESNKVLVPGFLLDEAFDPRPEWQPVIEQLDRAGEKGWGMLAWAMLPSTWLDDRAPVDVINDDPQAVLTAATRRANAAEQT